MLRPTRRGRGKRIASLLAMAAAALLVNAGAAHAAGLQNPGFESGLDGWTAEIDPEGPDGTVTVQDCEEHDHDPQRAICTLTSDAWTTALDGSEMVRLGGPFPSEDDLQFEDRYSLRQTLPVDAADPVLQLAYNAFSYDDHDFDELRLEVTDEGGTEIAELVQRSGAVLNDLRLKSTGWQSAALDLTGYEGEEVELG